MKKKPTKKFPRIYRIFTDPLRRIEASLLRQSLLSEARKVKKTGKKHPVLLKKLKYQSSIILLVVILVSIFVLGFDLMNNIQKQKEIDYQRGKIETQIKFWQDLASKFNDYKEAYYQIASLEYQLGNIDNAKYYLNKALYLDPNFEKARELEKILKDY